MTDTMNETDPHRPYNNFEKYLELVNNCDEHDPLLSATPLGHCLGRIQLDRVLPSCLIELNQALNVEQLIPTQSGLARDYRGLAELMGFSLVELEARFKRSHNPAKCLIEAYADRCRRQDNQSEATLNDLLKFLEQLERFDIIDDFLPTLIDIVQKEQQHLVAIGSKSNHDSNNKLTLKPQTTTIAQTTRDTHQSYTNVQSTNGNLSAGRYDAFVCFAREDEDHARELILILERHNKRIVTTDHLLPGQFEYDALVQMISTECRKVIILLTPNFLLSRECEFQTKFTNEISIKLGWFPKIIPVLYEAFEDSRLPYMIRAISKIDMTDRPANNRDWQFRKLLKALDYDSSLQGPSGGFAGMLYESADRSNQFASPSRCSLHRKSQEQQSASTIDDQRVHRNQTNSAEPIIDLAYSQSSDSAMNLSCQLSIMTSNDDQDRQPTPGCSSRLSTPSPSNLDHFSHHQNSSSASGTNQANQMNPLNWYRIFRRKVSPKSPCESMSPSTSSRAQLLQDPGEDRS